LNPGISGANPNGNYYVRAYNAPNLSFASGTNAPVTGTYYYQSALHTYAHSESLPDQWDFSSGIGGQTLLAIPEPAALGLGIIGLISLRFFGRKRA
jgi:hypothetical protein